MALLTEKNRSILIRHRQKIIAGLLWLAIIGSYTWYAWANEMSSVEAVQALTDFFRSPFGSLFYFVVYAIRPLLFFPASVITVAAGSIFGPWWGITLVILASNTSAMIAYGIGRYFGSDVFHGEEGSQNLLERYSRPLRRNSFETVIIMRFLFLPYDLVNYLCGFLRIDWKAYLLATILGSIPGTFAFVFFGAAVDISEGIGDPTFNPWILAASLAMVVISILISRFIKARGEVPA